MKDGPNVAAFALFLFRIPIDLGRSSMRHILIVSLIALSAALTPALAAASLQGQWRGSGTVSHRKATDAVRCRVSFQRLSTTSFSVSSQCATETGRYDVTGRVVASGGNRYSGPVQGQGVSGTAVVVQHGNRLSVTVTSRRGSAKLSLSRL
jgi:hypothetical protein